jgi:hypothetical protein
MKNGSKWILLALCASAGAVAACSTDTPATTGTGSGGTTSSQTGSGGTTASSGAGVTLLPDATGWIDKTSNSLMVQGPWYPYSDSTGVAKCTTVGMHTPAQCAMITMPSPTAMGFPNMGGNMCTAGSVEVVIGMPFDYSNMWGAGISLDLAASGGALSTKGEFNFTSVGVTGVAFDIDMVPGTGLRVEFAAKETDGTTAGNDYWGATSSYPNSPVMKGTNTVLWSKVVGPMGHVFNPAKVESIQFHVPTNTTAGGSYSFCISNLKLLM